MVTHMSCSRTPGFFGRFGRRGLLHVSFHGKSFGDEALASFIKTYGDRLSGLYLSNTGITDAGLRHLAGLPNLQRSLAREHGLAPRPSRLNVAAQHDH